MHMADMLTACTEAEAGTVAAVCSAKQGAVVAAVNLAHHNMVVRDTQMFSAGE